jgi:hypothetical protein
MLKASLSRVLEVQDLEEQLGWERQVNQELLAWAPMFEIMMLDRSTLQVATEGMLTWHGPL